MIPDSANPFWQYFDFISLTVLLIVIGFLLFFYKKKYGSLERTISETVAHDKKYRLVFSIVICICFPLYYAFIWFWVAPLTIMPTLFYLLIALSAICELIFVLVPAKPGVRKIIHALTAGFVGVAMFVMLMLVYIYGSGLNNLMKISIIAFICISVTLAALSVFPKFRKYLFTFEIIYITAFLTTISIIAHG